LSKKGSRKRPPIATSKRPKKRIKISLFIKGAMCSMNSSTIGFIGEASRIFRRPNQK